METHLALDVCLGPEESGNRLIRVRPLSRCAVTSTGVSDSLSGRGREDDGRLTSRSDGGDDSIPGASRVEAAGRTVTIVTADVMMGILRQGARPVVGLIVIEVGFGLRSVRQTATRGGGR